MNLEEYFEKLHQLAEYEKRRTEINRKNRPSPDPKKLPGDKG